MLATINWDMGTLAVVGTFAVPLAAILGSYWYKIERTKSNNQLKMMLLQQGKSIEEIERVIAAGVHRDGGSEDADWYKLQRKKSDNQLKQSMIQQGKSVEEIERVMAAGAQKDGDEPLVRLHI
jgi:hypothetical protein